MTSTTFEIPYKLAPLVVLGFVLRGFQASAGSVSLIGTKSVEAGGGLPSLLAMFVC